MRLPHILTVSSLCINPIHAKLNGMQSTSKTGNRLTLRNGNYLILFLPRTKALGKPYEALQSERRSVEKLYKVIMNLGKLFRSNICNRLRRMLTYCVLRVASLAFLADNKV